MKKLILAVAIFAAMSFAPKAKAEAWCGNYNATPAVGLFVNAHGGISPYEYCIGNVTGNEWGFILISWSEYWDLKPVYGL